jgi:hypothetical protein
MKSIYSGKSLFVLLSATLFWTACQKEISNKPVITRQEFQMKPVSGVIPDDPEKVAKVPLIVSTEFLKKAFANPYLMESLKGKPASSGGGSGKTDNTTPVVSITSPTNGATVSGVINVTVNATDNVGVKSVSLAVDGTTVASSSIAPFTNSWNSATVINGTHTLTVTAMDASGNKATNSIQVNVSNATVGDIISPSVNILSPTDQASLTGTVTVSISASDNVGVTAVSISIDNTVVSTSTSYSWNTENFAAGYHTVTAWARDAAGNQSSKSITVSINTVVVPPPPATSGVNIMMPPVGNQGGEGACVPFAIGYAARSAEKYYQTNATSYSNSTNVFSPEFIYNQTKISSDCASGTSIQTVLDFIKLKGVTTFQSMPFSSTNGCSLMPTSSQLAEALNYTISGYSKIYFTDRAAIKAKVSQNHPVIIAMLADNSFINAGPGFIWKTFSGSGMLAHCLVICGYDDTKNAYKVMNSWGTGWGDAGFSWIDYDFFETGGRTAGGGYVYVID